MAEFIKNYFFLLTNEEISAIIIIGNFYIFASKQIRKEEQMSNEQVKELLDMVMALPKENFSVKFEYCAEYRDVLIFVHGKKRCECCGELEDKMEFKMSDDYNVIKEFIEKWREIIEKENENDRGNN